MKFRNSASFSRFSFAAFFSVASIVAGAAWGAETKTDDAPASDFPVTKIWDGAPHNAFTDIIRWNGRFYCSFREGERHVHGEDGKSRVLASDDGERWESVALIAEEGVDLRDPKLSITPDDRLMVVMGGSTYRNRQLKSRLPRVAFLERGQSDVSTSVPVVIDPKVATNNDWLWRVVWHKNVGYGCVYQAFYKPGTRKGASNPEGRPWANYLVKTTNGVHYELVATCDQKGSPGESTPLFLDDGTMMIIMRNVAVANLGTSVAPYTDWKWRTLELELGGPNLIQLPDGKIVLGTRSISGPNRKVRRTILGTLARDGQFTKQIELPSGGDTSYPGLLVHDGKLWVSYYSSHEGRASIYLAKIPLERFQ